MIFFRYFYYLLISILSAVLVVSSSFPLQDSTILGNPDWGVNSGAVSDDGTNGNQESLIASGDLQGQNFGHGDSDLLSPQGGSDTNIPPDKSKDSAFLFDGNDGVTNVAPLNFPDPLRIFFPNGLPQFDPDGIIQWFAEPTEPSCDDGNLPPSKQRLMPGTEKG